MRISEEGKGSVRDVYIQSDGLREQIVSGSDELELKEILQQCQESACPDADLEEGANLVGLDPFTETDQFFAVLQHAVLAGKPRALENFCGFPVPALHVRDLGAEVPPAALSCRRGELAFTFASADHVGHPEVEIVVVMTPNPNNWAVKSRYVTVLPLPAGDFVLVHSLEGTRIVVTPAVMDVLGAFSIPQPLETFAATYASARSLPPEAVERCVGDLLKGRFLFAGTPEQEQVHYIDLASGLLGRNPEVAAAGWQPGRGQRMDRFAVTIPRELESYAPVAHELDVVLIGLCDVQIGMDILRTEARRAGVEIRPLVTFENDLDLLKEKRHDAIIVGALGARHGQWHRADGLGDLSVDRYLKHARNLVEGIRQISRAPILLCNLPVPTCSPLGIAERGPESHRERCRRINSGLSELAAEVSDLFIVDVDAALGFHGKSRLLDDQLVTFSHLGALGWWTMLPREELRFVHGVEQPMDDLRSAGVEDPFEYDRILAREELALLLSIFGFGRRKCVIVDLDNTLWPGVLADTLSPFSPDVPFEEWSFHSFYTGVHEALKALASRGILLACVSKNDEEVVRKLWKYPAGAPLDRLVTLDDFVTWRINWEEKVDNIQSIAEELNIGIDSLVFVDDNPVERDKVARYLPQVMLLGEHPMRIRWELLTSPYLQVPVVTEESRNRSDMTRAQIAREQARKSSVDQKAFLASLSIRCTIERVKWIHDLDRIHELILRTNQFNTTTLRLSKQEVSAAIDDPSSALYVMQVEDRFTNYGLVAVCLVRNASIDVFVMSCRVIGLGVENVFLRTVMKDQRGEHPELRGTFIPSDKNMPARNLFRDNGFSEGADGSWRASTQAPVVDEIEPFYNPTFIVSARGPATVATES